MNMETPKKWFVYINDHHEGPYSVSEVKDKIASKLVGHESYVWCEGMGDWAVITSIPELAALLSVSASVATTTNMNTDDHPSNSLTSSLSTSLTTDTSEEATDPVHSDYVAPKTAVSTKRSPARIATT